MLEHSGNRTDESIKNFFQDVNELYVKVSVRRKRFKISMVLSCFYYDDVIMVYFVYCLLQFSMNPFYRYDAPILSSDFDVRVRAVARKTL